MSQSQRQWLWETFGHGGEAPVGYGGESGGSGGSGNSAIDAILDAQSEVNQKYFAKVKEFDEKNPFKYDKVLADEIAKTGERLDPYYKQTLNDYLRGIKTKTERSIEDERRTLSDISLDIDAYSRDTKQNLEDALSKSREGYADVGMYFSGNQLKNTAKTGLESNENMSDYTRTQDNRVRDIKLSGSRLRDEDLPYEQSLFQRDVGQYGANGEFSRGARSEAEVRLQALPEVGRRQQQREFELRQYAGPPPGVTPGQYYLDTYSLLR